jgi:hypothetical protein
MRLFEGEASCAGEFERHNRCGKRSRPTEKRDEKMLEHDQRCPPCSYLGECAISAKRLGQFVNAAVLGSAKAEPDGFMLAGRYAPVDHEHALTAFDADCRPELTRLGRTKLILS